MEALSVIIPVYNCREYLENCISSIIAVNALGTTSLIHEIILVDDGSTDGSSELCDKLEKTCYCENCTIRVIHQSNRGVSAARNVGLHAATGTFLLFVDSDDTINGEKLAELMQIVGRDDSIDMAVFGMSFDYYSGKRIYRQDLMLPPVEGAMLYNDCIAILSSLYKCNAISSLCNKLIRRSVIEDAGISLREDMFLYEDLEFSLQVLARCRTVYFYTQPIYHYRQASDEGNAGRRLKRIAHIPEIIDKIDNSLAPFGGNREILISLYLVLAREKIGCATKKETDIVCDDFRKWVDRCDLNGEITDRGLAELLYDGKTYQLLFRREKTKIRHQLANLIKKTLVFLVFFGNSSRCKVN